MAVTASSAFPGFYPPINLDSSEIGAEEGKVGRLSFTDGGIFENLGIRMFRYIEHSWIGRKVELSVDEFIDINSVLEAINRTLRVKEETTGKIIVKQLVPESVLETQIQTPEELLKYLSKAIVKQKLYRLPVLENITLKMSDAQLLFNNIRNSDRELSQDDHVWLNRQILGEFLQLITGKVCLRPFSTGLDCVVVSNASKPFERATQSTRTSIISTSLRASDILMDRVGQLENEIFKDAPGFFFAATTQIVTQEEDPTALPVEIQRRIANIRTDMDKFSKVEISSLLRHGYCVARKLCKKHPSIFSEKLPKSAPWDPYGEYPKEREKEGDPKDKTLSVKPSMFTKKARILQSSSQRSIWKHIFDFKDVVSYLYVPILVPLLVLMPYFIYEFHRQSVLVSQLNDGISRSMRGYHF